MISVAIMINGHPVMARSAVNKGKTSTGTKCKYILDDGSMVLHDPEEGAVKLAIEMLKTIKELTKEKTDE